MRLPRIVATIFFTAFLATPLLYRQMSGRKSTAQAAIDPSKVVDRYGCVFRESSADVGITFRHTAPTFDDKLRHIMPQVASMGAAVSVVDYDRDGWSDIYVTNSGEASRNFCAFPTCRIGN